MSDTSIVSICKGQILGLTHAIDNSTMDIKYLIITLPSLLRRGQCRVGYFGKCAFYMGKVLHCDADYEAAWKFLLKMYVPVH